MREEDTNSQRLKQKLTNVCKATKFCGICLDDDEQLWALDTEFDIAVGQQTHKKLLKDIIDYILNDVAHQILASTHLCSQCTEKSIQSYLFIYNAKQLSQIVHKCVNELYSKTVDVQNQLTQSFTDYVNSNAIVIALEQDSEMCQYTDIGKMTEIVAKETKKSIDENSSIVKDSLNQVEAMNVNDQINLSDFEAVNSEKVIVETIQPLVTDYISHIENVIEEPKAIDPETMYGQENTESDNIKIKESNLEYENVETANIKFAESELTDSIENVEITFIDQFSAQDDHSAENHTEDVKISPSTRKKRKMSTPYLTYKCKRCREILPSYKGKKAHEKICRAVKDELNKHQFICKMCNELFTSQRTLNTHYKSHSKVKCKVCKFIIPVEDLTEHMKINHEDYIHLCKLCKFFSFNADGLKAHTKKNHSGSKCALCYKKVSETDLKLHKCRFNCLECLENICIHYKYLISYRDQVLNNVTKIKCIDCDYICPRREALLSHANREHLDHHPFTCAHCSQQFYSRTTLRHHLNNFHKEQHICEYCDQEFSSLSTLNNHKETCQNIVRHYKCDQCSSSFVMLEELANHVKLRHNKESFDCSLCKKQFLSNTKLQEHVFRIHSGLQMKRKRSILDCPICDVKYATKKQLLEHISIHGPGSRFPCKECEENFDSIKKLHAHARIHYDDVIQCVECKKVLTSTFFPHHMVYCKPGREETNISYTCETCGKIYNSEIQLKLHLKTHMEKIPCPICQKPTKPVYMKNHIRYMHSKPKKAKKDPKAKTKYYLKCDLCDHRVSRYGELETHVNRFHLKVKPYQCSHCNKSFFGNERLKDHLITHTTSKTCYCSVCNKKFENNVCLKLHMRRHTGEKPYACEFCGERFRTSSIMNTHKVKKHSERTVACPLCNSMFYLTREMRSHFKKVHWKQKGKKFDPREVKELSPAFYHLFEDGRLPKVEGEDLYISSKFNEKIS